MSEILINWIKKTASDELLAIIEKIKKDEPLTHSEESKLIHEIEGMIKAHDLVNSITAVDLERSYTELVADILFFVWQELKKYDPSRGSFSNFVWLKVSTWIKTEYRRLYEAKKRLPPSLKLSLYQEIVENLEGEKKTIEDIVVGMEPEPEYEMIIEEEIKEFIDEIDRTLGQTAKEILIRKLDGMTEQEITRELNITSEELTNILNKIQNILESRIRRI